MTYIGLKDRFRTCLKHFRFEHKLSQEQLGEKVGVSDKYISDLETGRGKPSFEMIEDFARIFEVDILEMLSDKYYEDFKDNKNKIDEVRPRVSRKD